MSKSVKISKPKPKTKYATYFFHYAYCLAIIALLIFTTVNINNYLNSRKVLGTSIDITPLQNEKVYWENLITSNPTYIDAYLELAKVHVELGHKPEAQNLIIKALILDPNSSKIPQVERELDF